MPNRGRDKNDIPVALQGLSAAAVANRLRADGPNALPSGRRRGWLAILLETQREPMFLLLLAASTLYLVFGEMLAALFV